MAVKVYLYIYGNPRNGCLFLIDVRVNPDWY